MLQGKDQGLEAFAACDNKLIDMETEEWVAVVAACFFHEGNLKAYADSFNLPVITLVCRRIVL